MPTRQPTLALNGTLVYASPNDSGTTTLSVALEEVTDFTVAHATLAPGELARAVDPPADASAVVVISPRPIRMRLNGGTTDITVGKAFVLFGTAGSITGLVLYNDQLAEARQVTVEIRFAVGGELV